MKKLFYTIYFVICIPAAFMHEIMHIIAMIVCAPWVRNPRFESMNIDFKKLTIEIALSLRPTSATCAILVGLAPAIGITVVWILTILQMFPFWLYFYMIICYHCFIPSKADIALIQKGFNHITCKRAVTRLKKKL